VRLFAKGAGRKIRGVNLRTLQQYELKTKDISKASVQTVMALTHVLGCQADDLLEYSTENEED